MATTTTTTTDNGPNGSNTPGPLPEHGKNPGAGAPWRVVVAIIGATGLLGPHLVNAILSPPFSDSFSELVLLSRRQLSPPTPPPGVDTKVTARQYSVERADSLAQALAGVDVLVSAVGQTAHELKEALVEVLPRSGVRLYLPSEFGVDHYTPGFPPHPVWDEKRTHLARVRERVPGLATTAVFCGLFLDYTISPLFGFDAKQGRYESIGPAAASKMSYTSIADVGRVVASLAASPAGGGAGADASSGSSTSPSSSLSFPPPQAIHTAGDSRTMAGIADIMGAHGGAPIEIVERPLAEYRAAAIARQHPLPAPFLRFLMTEGAIDHSPASAGRGPGSGRGCENEVVNPGQRFWRWKTVEDLARETRGRPWADVEWPFK